MDKTQETYEFVKSYIEDNNYPPTVREICAHLHFGSTSTADYHLKKLSNAGKIEYGGGKNRSIRLLDRETISQISLPVVGEIAAGYPILAEENYSDNINVSAGLFHGTNLFVLKVKGESMIDVGIYNGDYVVISKQSVATNGEIVACLIDDEATVKRFYKENGYYRLQPENPAMSPIYTDHVQILGKVVGLIRNKI